MAATTTTTGCPNCMATRYIGCVCAWTAAGISALALQSADAQKLAGSPVAGTCLDDKEATIKAMGMWGSLVAINGVACGTVKANDPCSSMAPGASMNCTVATNALLQACLPAQVTLKCDGGNGKAPDYAQANSVMCKPCGTSAAIIDQDPTPNKFFGKLTFGDLFNNNATGIAGADKYEVMQLDTNGRPMGSMNTVITVENKQSSMAPTCCVADKYSAVIKVDIADPATWNMRLGIRAVSGSMKTPFLYISAPLVDVKAGSKKVIDGNFTLSVTAGDVVKFKADLVKTAAFIGSAFAASIGADASEVTVTSLHIGGEKLFRRLAERRLVAATDVVVGYKVIAAPDKTITIAAGNGTAAQAFQDSLATNILTHAAAAGVILTKPVVKPLVAPMTVTHTTQAPVTQSPGSAGTTMAMTTTAKPKGSTGASSTCVFQLMAAIIAAGMHLSF